MRGKARLFHALGHHHGITPAYAGKSWPGQPRRSARRDHPRVCGEKVLLVFEGDVPVGSPPRMRGKGDFCELHFPCVRITPAHAGKSEMWSLSWQIRGSPPRMRGKEKITQVYGQILRITPAYAGKKAAIFRAVCVPKGSPPRMRGKAAQPFYLILGTWITPAYAGKRGVHS